MQNDTFIFFRSPSSMWGQVWQVWDPPKEFPVSEETPREVEPSRNVVLIDLELWEEESVGFPDDWLRCLAGKMAGHYQVPGKQLIYSFYMRPPCVFAKLGYFTT